MGDRLWCSALVHQCIWLAPGSAARADVPELAARARSAALGSGWQCNLARQAVLLPDEVEVEEESAAMAAARICRGRSWLFAGESRELLPTIGGDCDS